MRSIVNTMHSRTGLQHAPAGRAWRGLLTGCALAATGILVFPSPSAAQQATLTVNGGSLAFASVPGNVAFPGATLNGTNSSVSQAFALDISDTTGSGAGWNVQISATVMTAGSNTLPMATVPSTPPQQVCDVALACTPAVNTVGYPMTLAAAPARLTNANAGSGIGNGTVTPTFNQSIPGSSYAGAYTATWTVSLTSGP